MDESLSRLHPDAHAHYFDVSDRRLTDIYYSGLRDLLEQPRDFARVFNTVAMLEPALRGEVVLADIIGFAALMVKAPKVFELLKREPRWFAGAMTTIEAQLKKPKEYVEEGALRVKSAIAEGGHPDAIRRLVGALFPLTAQDDEWVSVHSGANALGRLEAPERLLIALQYRAGDNQVSLVRARNYLLQPGQRHQIVQALNSDNCLDFLAQLADMGESDALGAIDEVGDLCVEIARLADLTLFVQCSRDRSAFYLRRSKDVALMAMERLARARARQCGPSIAAKVVSEPLALSVAMEVFWDSYVLDNNHDRELTCAPNSRSTLLETLMRNVMEAASDGRLLEVCNPGNLLWKLTKVAPQECATVFEAMRVSDPTLDGFAVALLGDTYDSVKGQIFAVPDDLSRLESYCQISALKDHAGKRLGEGQAAGPARAAWLAVVSGKKLYGDGTEVAR